MSADISESLSAASGLFYATVAPFPAEVMGRRCVQQNLGPAALRKCSDAKRGVVFQIRTFTTAEHPPVFTWTRGPKVQPRRSMYFRQSRHTRTVLAFEPYRDLASRARGPAAAQHPVFTPGPGSALPGVGPREQGPGPAAAQHQGSSDFSDPAEKPGIIRQTQTSQSKADPSGPVDERSQAQRSRRDVGSDSPRVPSNTEKHLHAGTCANSLPLL